MAKGGTVAIKFVGDIDHLRSSIGSANRDLDGFGKKVRGGIGTFAKWGAAATAAGATLAVAFGKSAIDAYGESAKVAAQTEAAIKSTGGAAKVTAKQIGDMAERLKQMSGVEDEAIQSGSNLLLTFTNIQNQVGKGNDIFNQATAAMLDMSVALGQDTKSSAIQLGKALNDPVKGITALQRAGVSFTQAQRDQVKMMVAAGDTMGAQKLILAELTKEFGGSAKAAGDALTPLDKLRLKFGDLQEKVGGFIVNGLNVLIEKFGPPLSAAFEKVSEVIDKVVANVRYFGQIVVDAFQGQEIFSGGDQFIELLAQMGTAARQVADFVKDNLEPVLVGLAVAIGLLVSPVAVAVAALVVAYVKFEAFRDVVQTVIAKVGELVEWVKAMMPQFQEAFVRIVNTVKALWREFGDEIVRILRAAWETIQGVVQGALDIIRGIIQTVVALINGDWGKAWDGIKDIVSGAWKVIEAVVRGAFRILRELFEAQIGASVALWKAVWEGIKAAWDELWDGIKGAVREAVEFIIRQVDLVDRALGPLDEMIGKLREALDTGADLSRGSVVGGVTLGGKRAAGGPVAAGVPYMVGERGPEVFVPAGAGNIRPITRGSGGAVININVTAGGGDGAEIARAIRDELVKLGRRNGDIFGDLA